MPPFLPLSPSELCSLRLQLEQNAASGGADGTVVRMSRRDTTALAVSRGAATARPRGALARAWDGLMLKIGRRVPLIDVGFDDLPTDAEVIDSVRSIGCHY